VRLCADALLDPGRTEDYRGTLQFVIEACRPVAAEKVNLADFVPVTELDVEAMWNELLEILSKIELPEQQK